ncbi:hypothetical protein AM24_002 [Acinetobacter phage AM24]|nr:hypothetical protein AM24_002 [Acinetobacter phage AM24]
MSEKSEKVGKVLEIVMDYYDDWYAVPEVHAIEDKLKVGCMSMQVCVADSAQYVSYLMLCKIEDINLKHALMMKLARIARKRRIRGKFIVTAKDSCGNATIYIIDS